MPRPAGRCARGIVTPPPRWPCHGSAVARVDRWPSVGLSAVGPLRLNPTAASPPRARKHEGEDRTPLEAPRPAGGVAAGLAGPARGRLERGSSFSRPSGHDSDDMAAKGTSWLGEFWRPLAALLLWVVGLVPAIAAPPLLPVLAETRVGGLTAFPVDCIPAVPLFSSDLTRACGPPLYDSASGCSVAANRATLTNLDAARRAPGGVNYGALDALGRPTGIQASLTADMIGTGSSASRRIIPPGFSGGAAGQARGHLLGNQLGGSGTLPENLVTLLQTPTNSPIMSGFEAQVRAAVASGQTVSYGVVPVYRGSSLVPSAVTLQAEGTGGFRLGVSILNPPGR